MDERATDAGAARYGNATHHGNWGDEIYIVQHVYAYLWGLASHRFSVWNCKVNLGIEKKSQLINNLISLHSFFILWTCVLL